MVEQLQYDFKFEVQWFGIEDLVKLENIKQRRAVERAKAEDTAREMAEKVMQPHYVGE